jgi:hypothetical protein
MAIQIHGKRDAVRRTLEDLYGPAIDITDEMIDAVLANLDDK